MFELMLLRHGRAKKADMDYSDRDRPLKNSGKRSAQRLGVQLQFQGDQPDLVLSSPAKRALETAEKCVKAMGLPASMIETDERLYEGDAEALMAAIAERSSRGHRLLLVGHNPALEQLIKQLVPEPRLPGQSDFRLRKGMLVQLRLPATGALPLNGEGELIGSISPDQLPELFPWPGPGGAEQRERPAYYYTQSGVIPYRFSSGGRLELLLITSSSGRSWGVPKGIVEPGLTPQESAAKEALEEAGVQGKVHPELLGCYRQPKWGAECDVELFAMRVDSLIEDADWDEDHRCRRWCDIGGLDGAQLKPALRTLIDLLPERLKESGLWPV
ncbi:histidine phosphatase family protein [Marinobacterium lutimaris]|uniref:Phosphohistidine phosphatase n=1 Tax=Marinobacterium lutimaris TaxID=568106 RepID=A0A1H5VB48_9GAMM|nr:histidine phosphatase family protein [Marinobacterium lutimaris]SEF84539.1 phosphohistidine phosphatase [Marinobacterium lutimaris]